MRYPTLAPAKAIVRTAKCKWAKIILIFATMSGESSGDSNGRFGRCNRTHPLPPEDWKHDRKRAAKELAFHLHLLREDSVLM